MENENKIRAMFPNASTDFLARNSGKVAELESITGNAPLATEEIQRSDSGRFLVSIKSFRKRLIDEDNLAEKYHVDLCRYAGVLPSDAPDKCKIEVSQVKVGKKETERIMIEVFKIKEQL